MRFNNQQMIDFELNEKGTNEVYLRRAIQDTLEIKAQYETALLNALFEGL